MKTYLFKKVNLFLLIGVIFTAGCTDLGEEMFGSLSPDSFYQNDEEVLASLVGVYARMADLVNYGSTWRVQVQGTDEFIIPRLNTGGWIEGGRNHEFTRHQLTPTNTSLNGAWNQIFSVIGAANAVIDAFENSAQVASLKPQIAEVRALRAYAYFFAMDLFGNVPIFTESRVNPSDLPTTNQRSEVFDFVVSELNLAAGDLPSINNVNRAAYYPRYTKEAAYSILAIVYLNAEVYTGTAHWNDAVDMSDRVINSGAFMLEPNFISNFTTENHNSNEVIIAGSIDPAQSAGCNQYVRGALHPRHVLTYNLPFTPANGYKTLFDAVNKYDDEDVRKQYLVYGPQYTADGSPLTLSANSSTQVDLVPIVNYLSVANEEGARVLKYVPDGNFVGRCSGNDVQFIRYAEILLIKAEALLRGSGSQGTALELFNQVRTRSNVDPLTSISLQDIEDERAREFIWEGQRRRDMIRFGSYFTGTWKFKTEVTPTFRGIYPIPQTQLQGNSNLVQNPEY